jgi:hypothetical protein
MLLKNRKKTESEVDPNCVASEVLFCDHRDITFLKSPGNIFLRLTYSQTGLQSPSGAEFY